MDQEPLLTYLSERKCKRFVARPHYFHDGDFVTYYMEDEPCIAQRVDDLLTVYLSKKTDKLIGCKIKGVRRLLREGGGFGVIVEDEGVRLSLLFLVGLALGGSGEERRKRYSECGHATSSVFLEKRELPNNFLQTACA
jgi:hypothetical protein